MRNTRETALKCLENLIKQIRTEKINVEGISKTDHTDLINLSNKKRAYPYKTGRFTLELDLYDSELNNYKEVIEELEEG